MANVAKQLSDFVCHKNSNDTLESLGLTPRSLLDLISKVRYFLMKNTVIKIFN